MEIKKLSRGLFESLAQERRRVVSPWRLAMLIRRLDRTRLAPRQAEMVARKVLRRWQQEGEIHEVAGARGVFIVDLPFARSFTVADEDCLQEAAPNAVLAFQTGLSLHGLTIDVRSKLHALTSGIAWQSRIPLGSRPEDWSEIQPPRGSMPRSVGNARITWTRVKDERDFGWMIMDSGTHPLYVTDLERTLIDAVRSPLKSGGMQRVLEAWRAARSRVTLKRLIDYVERFDNQILRQRIGFLLETLELHDARINAWRKDLLRGGSCKLDPAASYSPSVNQRWNLSLNVPESTLQILGVE